MKTSLLILFTLCCLSSIQSSAQPAGRENFDSGWKFHRGDIPGALFSQPILGWRWKADDRGEASAAEMTAPNPPTSLTAVVDHATGALRLG